MARTGRPRNFDRDAALEQAMCLFWKHGYEGVSLDLLRQEMGKISSASFYAAFGSKEALYRETLALYLQTFGQVTAALRDTERSPRDRLETALRQSARMQTGSGHPPGCMVTLSATVCSIHGTAMQDLTSLERQENRAAILDCVQQATQKQPSGMITDAAGLAALFDGLLGGFSIQARDGVEGRDLDGAISAVLAVWDHWFGDTAAS